MTYFVRWRKGTIALYEYFEVAKMRWVPCDRAMLEYWAKVGSVHMNPAVNPVVALGRAA